MNKPSCLLAASAFLTLLSTSSTICAQTTAPASTVPSTQATPAPRKLLPLMVGDPAPALDLKHWIQGGPIAAYEPGKVTIVDFGAVWCEGCVKSLPALSLLAERSGGTIVPICIASEDAKGNTREAVEALIKGKGDEITAAIAWDPEQAMLKAWVVPSGQGSIPLAYIVNGEGVIAHIGKPDDPAFIVVAEQVAKGTWDLAKATADFDREMRPRVLGQQINRATRDKDWKLVLEIYDEIAAIHKGHVRQYGILKYLALVGLDRRDEARALGEAFLTDSRLSRDAQFLNSFAWDIVDPTSLIAARDLDLGLRAAQQAVTLTNQTAPTNLDTLARAHFLLGDRAKAAEIQRKSIEVASKQHKMPKETLDRMQRSLAEYEGENASSPESGPR